MAGALASMLWLGLAGCSGNSRSFQSAVKIPKALPLKKVLPNVYRIPKSAFEGTYLYLNSVTDLKYQGSSFADVPSGMYLDDDKLVQFVLREHQLDVVAVDPLFQTERDAEKNTLLASFPIRHVDIVEKKDSRGLALGEEIESEDEAPWRDRKYVVVDLAKDQISKLNDETRFAYALDTVEIVPALGSINFDVVRQLKDDTQVQTRYSFLKFDPSSTYQQREYPLDLQQRFGFFKTTTYKFDAYGRITQSGKKEFMDRWDLTKPIVYYLSKGCPDSLKPVAHKVFDNWNEVFEQTTGHKVLELKDNTGQQLGDLRYNMINCETSEYSGHGILGYGPQVANPRTGQIVKADVNVYLGTLHHSIFTERVLAELLSSDEMSRNVPTQAPAAAHDVAAYQGLASLATIVKPFSMSALSSLPAKTSSADLVKYFTKDFDAAKTLESARAELLKDYARSITRVNETTLETIRDARKNAKLDDDQIAAAIFTHTLTHELGHNFGLRHNFEASADDHHLDAGAHSSSVMDYGFRSVTEPQKPGPYDRAAIAVAYGDEAKTKDAVAANYLYCGDESVLSSRDALCNQFDAGSSLTDVVKNGIDEYFSSYPYNNLRFDRLHFKADTAQYTGRIARFLMPVRLAYDNAEAILSAFKSKSLQKLWLVAGQRVEADPNSKCDESAESCPVIELKITAGREYELKDGKLAIKPVTVVRRLDSDKFKAVLTDAIQARKAALLALTTIVLEDKRALSDASNDLTGEIESRGVLPDKLVALLMLGAPLPVPGEGTTSPFESARPMVGSLLTSILSDTFPTKGGGTTLHPFHPGLRAVALALLAKQDGISGAGETLSDLVRVDSVQVDADKWERMQSLQAMASLKPELEQRIAALKQKAFQHNLFAGAGSAALWVGFHVLKLPVFEQADPKMVGTLQAANAEASAAATELEALEKNASPDLRNLSKIESYRLRIQHKLADALLSAGSSDDDESGIDEAISAIEAERAKAVPTAYTEVRRGRFLRSDVEVPGYEFDAASGLLLRDNINRLEDRLSAMELLGAALEKMAGQDEKAGAVAKAAVRQLGAKLAPLREVVAAEKRFAAKLGTAFQSSGDGDE